MPGAPGQLVVVEVKARLKNAAHHPQSQARTVSAPKEEEQGSRKIEIGDVLVEIDGASVRGEFTYITVPASSQPLTGGVSLS